MSIRVFINPNYGNKPDKADGGIRRVVEAQIRHLPSFGVEIASSPEEADVINNHGAMLTSIPGIPSVSTGHGFYWSRYPWGPVYEEVNARVIETMRHAVAHTAPSEWVAVAMRRAGFFYPEVVYHGVDAKEWPVSTESGDYVLWNKARADFVSNPNDMQEVAALLDHRPFLSTIGRVTSNVKVIGAVPYDQMKKLVMGAGVYLATARETFGIGTLEAMASGVPVAGWDWGGQSEIVVPGETGYLAPPGDFKALAECIEKCFLERERLSANAADDARSRWTWEPRIKQYADIFRRVADKHNTPCPKVSVIITAYNLDKYLPDCLRSVQRQTFKDFECLVVDDAQSEATERLVNQFSAEDARIRYVRVPHNLGLPGARNFGFHQARGPYIRHLDADDYLADNAIALEVQALDNDWGSHIVYGHLEVVEEDGSRRVAPNGDLKRSDWPPDKFSWRMQMAHLNQLPSCAMMRREVLERSGGYRTRMRRNEDAEFWCRVTSLGFRAKKFTQAVTYYHRDRGDSKGAMEWRNEGKEPDWTAWFPWRMGGSDGSTGMDLVRRYGRRYPRVALVPAGAQGIPPENLKSWYVHDYTYPLVSVVVTVGPGHEPYLIDALDSIQAQTYPDWECIVVNDTGREWGPHVSGAPWARIVSTGGNLGTARARNLGASHARGKLLIWLDADDYWLPWFLEKMVSYYEINDGIVFSDFLEDRGNELVVYSFPEFDAGHISRGMTYAGSSVLIPRWVHEEVVRYQGGYDENIIGMEDWDYQIACHVHTGVCAYRISEPLFVYRLYSSTKREADYAKIDEITDYLNKKWSDYRTGGKTVACGCRTKGIPKAPPASTLASSGKFSGDSLAAAAGDTTPSTLLIQYSGPNETTFTVRGRRTGHLYRFGNNQYDSQKVMLYEDAIELLRSDDPVNPNFNIVENPLATSDPSMALGRPISVTADIP